MTLSHLSRKSGAEKVAVKFLEKLSLAVEREDETDLSNSGSVGITTYSDDAMDPETLLANADLAMYETKQHGRNAYRFYSRESVSGLGIRKLSELRRALTEGEFERWTKPS